MPLILATSVHVDHYADVRIDYHRSLERRPTQYRPQTNKTLQNSKMVELSTMLSTQEGRTKKSMLAYQATHGMVVGHGGQSP